MDISPAGKYRKLQKLLSRQSVVAVAFSGGVDSSFLLYAACATLDPLAVHAFHARSELLPPLEAERVGRAILERGCIFHPVELEPFGYPEFVANGPERCYLCKKKNYQTFLTDPAFPKGAVLFDGTNRDDLDLDRPGLRAVSELGIQTPLADVGLTKKDIRLLSRGFGLSSWDAHPSSCLATRIVQGEPITREKILLVFQCEMVLQKMGFLGVRVRLSGEVATIAVMEKDLARILRNHVITDIKDNFMLKGLNNIVIDPQGRPDLVV